PSRPLPPARRLPAKGAALKKRGQVLHSCTVADGEMQDLTPVERTRGLAYVSTETAAGFSAGLRSPISFRSNQSRIASNRISRCAGDPVRLRLCDSAGKMTSSTSRFSTRRIANRSSAWPIGQRRSSSECRTRSGVVMFAAYFDGEIWRYTSGASNQYSPTMPLKAQPISPEPPSSTKLLTERSEQAARKRSLWL